MILMACCSGANVDIAIKAWKLKEGTLLHNRERTEIVNESLNEGYCNMSDQVGNLELPGRMQVRSSIPGY